MPSFDDRLARLSKQCESMRTRLGLARQEPPAQAAAMIEELERELGLAVEEIDDLLYHTNKMNNGQDKQEK